jgi:uncharacterized protein (TIGR02996 family)
VARPEVLAFLADIKEHPLDRTPRLVLADWLEERDDVRGTLVRLQCEQARPDLNPVRRLELGEQEARLIGEHQDRWLGPLRPRITSFAFQRGLVQLQSTPDRIVREESAELLDSEELAWVETIRLYGDTATPVAYAETRALQGARVLDCSWTRMQDLHLTGLARAAPFPFLGELLLNACNVGPAGLGALAGSGSFPALAELRLASCGLDDAALVALAAGPLLSRLHLLDLRNNRVGRAGLAALDRAGAGDLRELSLMHNHLDDDVVPLLTGGALLGGLHVLDLRGNRFTPAAQRRLQERFGPRVRLG